MNYSSPFVVIVGHAARSFTHERSPLLRLAAVGVLKRKQDLGDLAPQRVFIAAEPVEDEDGYSARRKAVSLSAFKLLESKISCHWTKIAVVVGQRCAFFDAPGPDQQVDCLVDRDPTLT